MSEHTSIDCDLLVLGAGMAGLSAAGHAAERGANVIVLEKAGRWGGSALLSGGVLWTATSPGRMRLHGLGRPELGEVVLRNYVEGMAWLRRRGVAMSPVVTALHGRGYQIDILDHLRGCVHRVEQGGGHVSPGTDTECLLTDAAGAVIGARTRSPDGIIDVRAKATLLATGGFQNSAELRGRYIEFGKTGDAAARIVEEPLNSLENGIKVRRKLLDTLHENGLLESKTAAEQALRASVAGDAAFGDPWADIARATTIERELYLPYLYLEAAAGFNSATFRHARALVRAAAERAKPNAGRLREYTDAALPRLAQQVLAPIPVYPELENLTLSFSLERMREWLGPDHPVVRRLLARDSPDTLAARLVAGTRLGDPAVRQALWDGGAAAIAASSDPMIRLALEIDGPARAVRKQYEDEVEAPIDAAKEKIAAARFKAYGTNVYPDATFTLRLNFGTVAGWNENGREIAPITHLATAFERATGSEPFRIPDSWQKVRDTLDMQTPFCISTTSDIVGGNSGSPLIDAQGRIVGLMFDGNIHSISGNYWFDAEKNRATALHPAIIRVALEKVYRADAVLRELGVR